jgi:hypothetical protein
VFSKAYHQSTSTSTLLAGRDNENYNVWAQSSKLAYLAPSGKSHVFRIEA